MSGRLRCRSRVPPRFSGSPAAARAASFGAATDELADAAAVIPAGAAVNADSALDVWFANRHQINDFPDMLDAGCYVVIDRQAFLGGPTQVDKRRQELEALPTSGRSLLYDDGRFEVWSPVTD